MTKRFFFSEDHETSNITSAVADLVTITPNTPDSSSELFVGISMRCPSSTPGEAWTAIDADELRGAIDKAVGPRKGAEPQEGAKPYRPIDRDRLLRHIADIEATLARRNERHEEDQERIRELEETITGLRTTIEELEAGPVASPEKQLEALEKMGADREVVLDPPRLLDTEGARAKFIPATEVKRISSYVDGAGMQGFRLHTELHPTGWFCRAQQVLELGVTAEDFGPSAEARRKKYEEQGLEEWEIELLMGADA